MTLHQERETKVYMNGPGHMTKMATTPIYGHVSVLFGFGSARYRFDNRLGSDLGSGWRSARFELCPFRLGVCYVFGLGFFTVWLVF